MSFEIGIYSLADIGPDPFTNETPTVKERLSEIIQAATIADELGLDIFGIGEHHRLDYVSSSPAVILAAIASATKNIRLTSTTSVISTLDPVRLYEDFATLDLISNGRAEIIAGRGAFIESFPLFGYSTKYYDELFEEHMDLLLEVNENEKVTWSGTFRPSFANAEIAPRALQERLPIWIGVGGTPGSAKRAGRLGVGMALAILGGDLLRFQPLVDIYRNAGLEAGHSEETLKVVVTGHAYIAETTEQAIEEFYPYYKNYWSYVNKQRGGLGFRLSKEDFDEMTAPNSALFVGSPELVAEKILKQQEAFGHSRFIAQVDIGGLPFHKVRQSIELLATKVLPIIKRELSQTK